MPRRRDDGEVGEGEATGPSRGTGGNEVALLLKAGRDATRRACSKITEGWFVFRSFVLHVLL